MARRRSLIPRPMIVALVATMLISSPAYAAPSYTDIGGVAYTTAYTWYSSTPRYVTDPAQPGAEVVHKQYTGPNGLQLGAYVCGNPGTFPWGRYPQDFSGIYRTVADGVPDNTCFYLFTLSDSGSGNFTGRLGWDG